MRAEFCIFESNAPGLKANFYEPYVDKPSHNLGTADVCSQLRTELYLSRRTYIPSVSPLAFAPRSRSKSLQFHLLNLSRATSETVLHYTIVFEKKIHEIFVNQDEQRVLPIIVWTSIAVRLLKHDPWSSPASDVTEHDVILHIAPIPSTVTAQTCGAALRFVEFVQVRPWRLPGRVRIAVEPRAAEHVRVTLRTDFIRVSTPVIASQPVYRSERAAWPCRQPQCSVRCALVVKIRLCSRPTKKPWRATLGASWYYPYLCVLTLQQLALGESHDT